MEVERWKTKVRDCLNGFFFDMESYSENINTGFLVGLLPSSDFRLPSSNTDEENHKIMVEFT